METKVDYQALMSAYLGLGYLELRSSIDEFSDSFLDAVSVIEEENIKHGCFSGMAKAVSDLQEEARICSVERTNLLNAIHLIMLKFTEAELDIKNVNLNDLNSMLNHYFESSKKGVIGTLPFQYHEIENFNKLMGCDFRIQGYTMVDGYYFISAYDKSKRFSSRLYVYDRFGKYKSFINLDSNAHVGGISYDTENGLIYITGKSGVIESYLVEDIVDMVDNATFDFRPSGGVVGSALNAIANGNIDISDHIEGKTSAATTYYSEKDKALYVVDCAKNGTLVKYNVEYDANSGNVISDKGQVISDNFASCCQGVATYEDVNGKNYIYASQSYGSKRPSVIKKYEISSNGTLMEVGATIVDKPGLEGIQVDTAGNLSGVFENFAGKNNSNSTYNANVNNLDFSKKLNELDSDLEAFYKKSGQANKDKMN